MSDFELDDIPTEQIINQWAGLVHGEWLWYNDDNVDDQTLDVDGFNRLVKYVTNVDDKYMNDALGYLLRMEEAAHAAAHLVEGGDLVVPVEEGDGK